MDKNELNKMIGYAVMAIFAYYLLQIFIPFLIWGAIGMVVWRIYLERNKF